MNNVNKTLYIPLYGKAFVSEKGIILKDKKAEEIWREEQFPLQGKAKSKWLAYYMGMRSAVFDAWVKEKTDTYPDCIVLHLGCGLDSRVERISATTAWFDIDFEAVINERKRYYTETERYTMLPADIKDTTFLQMLPKTDRAIVLLEGVSMYLSNEQLQNLFAKLSEKFPNLNVLLDCYTPFAAKMSKIKNPIKSVGVGKVFGVKSPSVFEQNTNVTFVKEHEITPRPFINELQGAEKRIFQIVYAGKMSKRLYKLYEYTSDEEHKK